jgi:hypothetical protein
MSRISRVRISEKRPIAYLLKNYGVGGAENYDADQITKLLRALALLLDCTGYVELDHVARFLLQLTNKPRDVWERAMEELEELGFYG